MLAECTCSAVFGALPRGTAGGQAMLGYMELTRLALERCATAREAIQLMGALAEEHGFHGNTTDLGGAAESLCIIDTTEAWVFHILADDTGSSAIWAAQRLEPGHAAACCNMFVIRAMVPEDTDRFLMSASALQVATRLGLWDPAGGAPFDFAACYSAGEARHRHYSGVTTQANLHHNLIRVGASERLLAVTAAPLAGAVDARTVAGPAGAVRGPTDPRRVSLLCGPG